MSRSMRRRRGVAMVEAVVALPFFIIIFVSMLYVGKLYAEKQRTLREAKEQAWTYALDNCEGSPPTHGGRESSPNAQGAGLPHAAQKYGGEANGGDLMRSWGTAVATVKASVTAGKLIGGATNKLSTTTRMQCNEKPQDGNARGVLHMAWKLWKFW